MRCLVVRKRLQELLPKAMARFSIVLTTTDRPSLLPAGVRAVLETNFDDLELIVSDNFSRMPASEILADVRDKRLRIIRTDRRLTAPDHWEFAWEHVRGEYVMYLGDDNALHPEILAFADRAIRDHDLEILLWRACTYYHPGWDIVFRLAARSGQYSRPRCRQHRPALSMSSQGCT